MIITTLLIQSTDSKYPQVIAGSLSKDEIDQNLKEFVCGNWESEMNTDINVPTPEMITEKQIEEFFSSGHYSYHVAENLSDFEQKAYVFLDINKGKTTVDVCSNAEMVEKKYRKKVFEKWEEVVGEDCPVESAEELTEEMIDEFSSSQECESEGLSTTNWFTRKIE